jgi:cytochrome b subunit of formate dehydrogenase
MPTSRPERRFGLASALVHWYLAAAIVTLIVTGTMLIVPALSAHVPRPLVNRIHIDAGLSGTVVFVVGILGPWGRSLRGELKALMVAPLPLVNGLATWSGRWLARAGRVGIAPSPDRYNLGQRIFAGIMAGLLVLALATGLALRTPGRLPLWLQAGCQLTHELAWIAITIGVLGHIAKVIETRLLRRVR